MTIAAASDGVLGMVLERAKKKTTYRFVGRAAADSTATASPPVTSQSFVID